VLDQGAKLIFARFPGQPDIQAELLGTVSRIYADLGASQTAIDYAKRQLSLLDELPEDHERRARALMVLAEASKREGLNNDAEAYATRALRLIPDDTDLRSDALVLLARSQYANGNNAAAAESLAAVERLVARLGNRPTSAKAWVIWLKGLNDQSSDRSSIAAMREAIQMAINVEGPLSPTCIDMRISLGRWLIQTNNVAEGRKVIESAIAALQISGGAGALRAAVVSANIWKWLYSMRAIPYAEASATIESSRALLASSSAPIPPIVLANIDYELADVRVIGGDLRAGGPDLKNVAPVLLAAKQSVGVRFDIVATLGNAAMVAGDHELADVLLAERSKLRADMGQATVPFAASDWAIQALNATMKADYDRALAILQAAPTFGAVDSDPIFGDSYPRIIPNAMARLRLAMGDVPAAARSLPNLPKKPEPDDNSTFYERALHAEVQCRLGAPALALPTLVESIQSISVFTSEVDPGIARLRAVAGLCALSAGNRGSALAFASQARAAFTAQPGVSPYYKAPLFKLERALGLKLPPV
jgi:tetratricopeptide (TPR) repeat protein